MAASPETARYGCDLLILRVTFSGGNTIVSSPTPKTLIVIVVRGCMTSSACAGNLSVIGNCGAAGCVGKKFIWVTSDIHTENAGEKISKLMTKPVEFVHFLSL